MLFLENDILGTTGLVRLTINHLLVNPTLKLNIHLLTVPPYLAQAGTGYKYSHQFAWSHSGRVNGFG